MDGRRRGIHVHEEPDDEGGDRGDGHRDHHERDLPATSRHILCIVKRPTLQCKACSRGGRRWVARYFGVPGERQLITWYTAGAVPTLRSACREFDALKMIEPGPTRFHTPSLNVSTVPSRMMISSSFGCLCGSCEASPGLSVVMCISSSSSVAVG